MISQILTALAWGAILAGATGTVAYVFIDIVSELWR
jgi:hypothetical protein